MPISDLDLLQACRANHTGAWETLLDQYERLVFSIPLNYGLSRDQAADITQLTFTIFLQQLDRLQDDSNLAAWLTTVARRHTWRHLNHRQRELTVPDDDLREAIDQMGLAQGSDVERYELIEWLHDSISWLGERCRQLLYLLYFEPTSPPYNEVATQLGISVGSVGPTRARCLARLKELLLQRQEQA